MSHRAAGPAPIALVDPGWLFIAAGVLALAAAVLIPAVEELAEARYQRDRMRALEDYWELRIEHYQRYLDALERGEPALVRALAQTQLNLIPADRTLVFDAGDISTSDASVFPSIEPPNPPALPSRVMHSSTLQRWTMSGSVRPWLIAGGALVLLIGLLPPATRARALSRSDR